MESWGDDNLVIAFALSQLFAAVLVGVFIFLYISLKKDFDDIVDVLDQVDESLVNIIESHESQKKDQIAELDLMNIDELGEFIDSSKWANVRIIEGTLSYSDFNMIVKLSLKIRHRKNRTRFFH